jgi:hypothetical protein
MADKPLSNLNFGGSRHGRFYFSEIDALEHAARHKKNKAVIISSLTRYIQNALEKGICTDEDLYLNGLDLSKVLPNSIVRGLVLNFNRIEAARRVKSSFFAGLQGGARSDQAHPKLGFSEIKAIIADEKADVPIGQIVGRFEEGIASFSALANPDHKVLREGRALIQTLLRRGEARTDCLVAARPTALVKLGFCLDQRTRNRAGRRVALGACKQVSRKFTCMVPSLSLIASDPR